MLMLFKYVHLHVIKKCQGKKKIAHINPIKLLPLKF